MRPEPRRIDWAHVVLASAITAFCVQYLFVALSASARLYNLILIAPMAVLAVVLYAIIMVRALAGGEAPPGEGLVRVGLLMALLALYVATLPVAGFDIGTALFMAACMAALGERRLPLLLGYPVAVALLLGWAMRSGLSLDPPTVLF